MQMCFSISGNWAWARILFPVLNLESAHLSFAGQESEASLPSALHSVVAFLHQHLPAVSYLRSIALVRLFEAVRGTLGQGVCCNL